MPLRTILQPTREKSSHGVMPAASRWAADAIKTATLPRAPGLSAQQGGPQHICLVSPCAIWLPAGSFPSADAFPSIRSPCRQHQPGPWHPCGELCPPFAAPPACWVLLPLPPCQSWGCSLPGQEVWGEGSTSAHASGCPGTAALCSSSGTWALPTPKYAVTVISSQTGEGSSSGC